MVPPSVRLVSSNLHLFLLSSVFLDPQPPIPVVQAWGIQQQRSCLKVRTYNSDNHCSSKKCTITRVGTTLWSMIPESPESSLSIPLTEKLLPNTASLNEPINKLTSQKEEEEVSALHLIGESNPKSDTSMVPSYSKLLLFASTTVIIWLSEPLLSLVDTTIVGHFASSSSSIIQLASLGPATTYIDSLFYTTYFLSIATTNNIASNLAQENYTQLQRTVSHVSSIAAMLGMMCTIFTFAAARHVLPQMAGSSGTQQLLLYATRYVYIRASVAIASILAITSQSICLAIQDTFTPAMAVLATSLTNIVGDILLRQYGVHGAAAATALATLVSCSILLRAVYQQWIQWRTLMPTEDSSVSSARRGSIPAPKMRVGPPSLFSMFAWPDRKSAYQLITLAGPIFFVILAKVLCYGAMTIRCTNFGVEALAAHSIMMRLFFFFACFGDSLSQIAQSFLPAVLYNKKSSSHAEEVTLMIRRLLTVGAWVAVVNSQISTTLVRSFGHYLTKDVVITKLMKNFCHFMGLSLLVHPFIMLLEGIVLANRDFRTLIVTYAMTMGMHFTILSNFSNSFPAVWRTFFLFQCTRLSLYAYRVFTWWWKLRSSARHEESIVVPPISVAVS